MQGKAVLSLQLQYLCDVPNGFQQAQVSPERQWEKLSSDRAEVGNAVCVPGVRRAWEQQCLLDCDVWFGAIYDTVIDYGF